MADTKEKGVKYKTVTIVEYYSADNDEYLGRFIEGLRPENNADTQLQQETEKKCIELMTTHTEHDGGYCDTGEDMEWACRSECVEMAVNRIKNSLTEKQNV